MGIAETTAGRPASPPRIYFNIFLADQEGYCIFIGLYNIISLRLAIFANFPV